VTSTFPVGSGGGRRGRADRNKNLAGGGGSCGGKPPKTEEAGGAGATGWEEDED